MTFEYTPTKLGKVTNWQSGGTPKKDNPDYWGGTIPWISASSMSGMRYDRSDLMLTELGLKSGSKLAKRNAVLLLVRGSALHKNIPVGIALIDVAFNQDVKAIIADEKAILPLYLLYWIKAHEQYLLENVVEFTGIGAGKLDTQRLQNLDINLPSLSIQKRIISVAKALDDRIDLLKKTNQTLEAIAQTLFKSWFVNFDPVHANHCGDDCAGINAETAELFPDSFGDSELGQIPKGWHISTVGKVYQLTMGQSPAGVNLNTLGNGIEFYQGRADFGFRYPTQRVFCVSPTRIAKENDILISVRAPVGDVNVALNECCIGRGVAAIRHPLSFQSFALYQIKQLKEIFKIFDGEGTVFGSISKTDFENIKLIAPSPKLAEIFERIVSPIDDRIKLNENQILELSKIRDTLLPRLINGKLGLSAIEAQLEETA